MASSDKDNIASKKRKRIPLDAYDFGSDGGGGGGGGFGGGLGGDGSYGALGDGGLDPSGLGRMDGGVGGGGIGGNGMNNFLMTMQGNGELSSCKYFLSLNFICFNSKASLYLSSNI